MLHLVNHQNTNNEQRSLNTGGSVVVAPPKSSPFTAVALMSPDATASTSNRGAGAQMWREWEPANRERGHGVSAPNPSRSGVGNSRQQSGGSGSVRPAGQRFSPLWSAYRRLSASLWSWEAERRTPTPAVVGSWANLVVFHNWVLNLRL